MLRNFALVLFLLSLPMVLSGQVPFPEPGPVFRDDIVPIVRIYIAQDSLDRLYASPTSNHEFPARFVFESGTCTDTLPVVGLRFRGNTSRASAKKSFKISFNTFYTRQTFFGLEKMNLNGEHNDPSIIRSKLCWDLYRLAGIPAPRANHVRLYINDVYKGLYINVEQIDEEFVQLRFGNKDGNLYKCLYPADLTYQGKNPDQYKFTSGSRRAYALKTNEEEDNYSDLALMVEKLTQSSTNILKQEFEPLFNVETLLRMMVVDIFTGNWDGPFYNKNNFYLYHNTSTGKFEIMPYDVDNTFGIDWFNIDWAKRNPYSWSPSNEARPLYTRILSIPAYRKEFTRLFRDFLIFVSSDDYLVKKVRATRDLIAPCVISDPLHSSDYGWSYNDFLNSYNNRLNTGHVKYGVIPFINARIEEADRQLDARSEVEDPGTVPEVILYPNPASGSLTIENAANYHSFRLINSSGQLVKTQIIEGNRICSVDLGGLTEGLYYLILDSSYSQPLAKKILISGSR